MDRVTHGMFLKVCSTEFIIGSLGNGFIVLVNCVDWAKRGKLSSVDHILTALAISRLALLWLVLIGMLFYLSYMGLLVPVIIKRMISISWIVANHLSIWLATCLSIFYFLKVANFSNSTFRSLKCRVNEVVLVTLLVSLLLLSFNIVASTHVDFWIDESTSNRSYSSRSNQSSHITEVLLFTCSAFMFVPFTVSLTAFVLLGVSLWKHMKNLQPSVQGGIDASTTAHVRALKTMVAFLLLYIIFLLLQLIQIVKLKTSEENAIIMYDQIIGSVFSTGHSFVLILAHGKLRQALLKALWWARRKLTDAPHLGP